MTKKNTLNTFKGTRDISGDEMRWRLNAIKTIQQVFELFGFEPLETPILERTETLLGKYGDEAENLLFMLAKPHDYGGLRYDHTVPLARFAAANWNKLQKPYKRYVVGPVFRAENPQSGRFRQFYQCDFDTLGSSSLAIDAEIAAVNYTVLTRLGFKKEFTIQFNDRRLLNALVGQMGFKGPLAPYILRAWDKLDKKSLDEVSEYLEKEAREFAINPQKLRKTFVTATKGLLEIQNETTQDILTSLRKRINKNTSEVIKPLEELSATIDSLGVPRYSYQLNPLLARGLSYYTGPIFETVVNQAGVGSVTGGGRFDNLIETMGGPSVPASGSSFGLDRLLAVIEELGIRPENSQNTQVFVTILDQTSTSLVNEALSAATKLRKAGIPTEVYSGGPTKLGKQIQIAGKKNIPYLLIIGSDEISRKVVTLKDLGQKKEQKISINEAISYLKSQLHAKN